MIEHKGSIGHIRAPEFLRHEFKKKDVNTSRLKQHRAVRIIPPRSGRIHNRPQRSVFEDRVLLLLTLKPGYKQPRGPLSENASCIEDTSQSTIKKLEFTRVESIHYLCNTPCLLRFAPKTTPRQHQQHCHPRMQSAKQPTVMSPRRTPKFSHPH